MPEPPLLTEQTPTQLQYGRAARSSGLIRLTGVLGFVLCLAGPFTGLVLYRTIEWFHGRLEMPVPIAMIEPLIFGMALAFITILLCLTEPPRAGRSMGYLALSGAVIGTIWFALVVLFVTAG